MKESTYKKYCLVIDEWFVNGFNQTQSVKKHFPDKTDVACHKYWERMSKNVEVQEYIKSKQKAAQEHSGYSHEKILDTLKSWMEGDITETINISLEDVKKLPKELRLMITEISADVTRKGEDKLQEKVKLKFVSKERALEMIAKHTGFYEKHNDQKNPKQKTIDELLEEKKKLDSLLD